MYTKFRAALGGSPQSVAVVGAGLIGSELANDLALAGHHVTLLDVASRPLAACLDAAQSAQLVDAWKTLPISFIGLCRSAVLQKRPLLKALIQPKSSALNVDKRLRSITLLLLLACKRQADTLATSVAGI